MSLRVFCKGVKELTPLVKEFIALDNLVVSDKRNAGNLPIFTIKNRNKPNVRVVWDAAAAQLP